MVAWVVIDRQHLRQTSPSFFPCSNSHFGTHPALIPEEIIPVFSCTYVEPILQPLCFHIHACNGGGPPSSGLQPPIPYSQSPIPFLFKYVRTLLHFFALFCTHQKLNSFIFNQLRTLCKKHRGVWGTATAARFAEREAPC